MFIKEGSNQQITLKYIDFGIAQTKFYKVKAFTEKYWPHMIGEDIGQIKNFDDRMKTERYMLGRVIMQIMIDALISKL